MNRKQKRNWLQTIKKVKGNKKKKTKGAFGFKKYLSDIDEKDFKNGKVLMVKPMGYASLKVIPKSKRTKENSNKYGVKND